MEKCALVLLVFFVCGISRAVAVQCDTCGPECPATASVELSTSKRCRCDVNCTTYGDCCASSCGRVDMNTLQNIECRRTENVFLDKYKPVSVGVREAYWMVSACSEDWLTSSDIASDIHANCTNGDASLPPVSDRSTGLVYKNEYCAVCNGVSSAVRWRYGLGCTEWLSSELVKAALGYVYFELTLEIINRECIICGYEPPEDLGLGYNARACYSHVSTCLSQEDLSLSAEEHKLAVESCKTMPFNPVWGKVGATVYRNTECAQCNGETVTLCSTLPGETFPGVFPPPLPYPNISFCAAAAQLLLGDQRRRPSNTTDLMFPSLTLPPATPFSVVLDVRNDGLQVTTSVISVTFDVVCGEREVYDPATMDCRSVVCSEVFQSHSGGCVFPASPSNSSCPGALIQLTEDDDFKWFLDNSTVIYSDTLYKVVELVGEYPVICVNFSKNGTKTVNETLTFYTYPTAYFFLTYIGCSFSLVGVAVILLSLALFKDLWTLTTALLANMATAILVANFFILVGGPVTSATQSQSLCESVGIILHFFFLAQFSWMTVMSIEVVRTLLRGVRLRVTHSTNANRRRFLLYLLVGWGCPLAIVGVSLAINYYPSTSHLILYGRQKDGGDGLCWINHTLSAIVAFLVPVALSLLINLSSLTIVSIILIRALCNQMSISHSAPYTYMRVYCAMFFSSGATWLFGFLAIAAARDWAWYPFIVFNSVQGFTLFLAFMFTRKVGTLYLCLFSCGRLDYRPASSTSSKFTGRGSSSTANGGASKNWGERSGSEKKEKDVAELKTVKIVDSYDSELGTEKV